MNIKDVEVGGVYQVMSRTLKGIDYPSLYKQGRYVHVRILQTPSSFGMIKISTRDKNGTTLGSCTEWDREQEYMHCNDLEEIADDAPKFRERFKYKYTK